jgi:fibronectin-binding autotransporter adhesin
VNITGGTLEGTGTVTGALNVTGGTVVGGSLSSTPATLNVSGAYSQSGSGILQADINTGDTPQSSIVNVTGSSGTPGSPGSVNLSGGTLLIDGQSSLALNTPYTVMTFAASDLYGQFAQVKTEGSLGSNTGNGDSVNLGNGDTLEVLYNEASGVIQVEMVTTPASTTYTWDVGSGTWNASSGADWNPPGNSTTPSSNSNVTIGTGGGGTVTLAQDQTIASLSITNGYTLSGSGNSITTTGNVSLVSGATLSIDDMNVGGTFTDSGSATFAGVLTMNGAGQLLVSSGSLTGGINGSGTFESSAGTNTLGNVTIYKGTTFTSTSGATTDISSGAAIVNQGTFVVDGTSSNAIVNLLGNVTLSGGGEVLLKTKSGTAFLRGGGFTLTNTNNTIEGAGTIGDNAALAIVNKGTIDANSSGQNLIVSQGAGGVTNTGTLEATGGGTLNLYGAVTNTGGSITASGTSSDVDVQSTTIVGGTLNTASGGLLQTVGSSILNGVTISTGSTYTTAAGATTQLNTSLTNDGTFLIDGSAGNAVVNLGSAVTLSGGGTVTMKTGSGTAFLRGVGLTLTNTNNTIQGAGTIGDNGALAIGNQATIDANASGQSLNLSQGGGVVTNTGTLEATGGGTLQIFSKVTNTGGAITANGGTVNIDGATITGGTLNATGANLMQTVSGTTSTLNGVTISTGSSYTTGDGATTDLNTSLTNDGTFLIDGSAGNAVVNLGSNVTLSGGGVVKYEV